MKDKLNAQIEKMKKQGDKSKVQYNFGTDQPDRKEKNKHKQK